MVEHYNHRLFERIDGSDNRIAGGNPFTSLKEKFTSSDKVQKVGEVISRNKKQIIESLIAFVVVFILVFIIKKYVLGLKVSILDTVLIIGGTILTKPIVSVAYNKITGTN
jgi:phage-related minor tail protein